MMKGPHTSAMAIRKQDGSITVETWATGGGKWYSKVPVVRGVVNFISMLFQGYKCLMLGIRGILDGTVDRNCAKAIYDYVAVKVGVKPGQVDRAIRHAIRKTAQPAPNKEFLLRAADDLAFSADAHAFLFGSSVEPSG